MPTTTVTITISGPQGTGKSILANAIADLLEVSGIRVELVNDDRRAEGVAIEELASLGRDDLLFTIVTTNVSPV